MNPWGGARRYLSRRQRFDLMHVPEPNSGCWLWTGGGNDRYGVLVTNRQRECAHRVSWELFLGSIPKGMCVLHKCDIGWCVNPNNLFLGTYRDNTQDMLRKGRQKNKLDWKKVIFLRSLPILHVSEAKELATKWKVNFNYLYKIRRGTTWRIKQEVSLCC